MNDPYPETLEAVEFAPPSAQDPQIAALNRIAVAVEQLTLAILDRPQPVQNAPGPALASLPPVQTIHAQTADLCPTHGTPWKIVPAGISKKSGKAYDAFRACSTAGCDQRPRI